MSIHLIDTLVVAARKADIAYISLIWDAPYHKVFTDYGRTENCWYSTFDRVDAEKFREGGIAHVLYQPLAVDAEKILEWDRSMGAVCLGGMSMKSVLSADSTMTIFMMSIVNIFHRFCRNISWEFLKMPLFAGTASIGSTEQ